MLLLLLIQHQPVDRVDPLVRELVVLVQETSLSESKKSNQKSKSLSPSTTRNKYDTQRRDHCRGGDGGCHESGGSDSLTETRVVKRSSEPPASTAGHTGRGRSVGQGSTESV